VQCPSFSFLIWTKYQITGTSGISATYPCRQGAFFRYPAAAKVFLDFDVYLKKLVDHKDVKFYFTMIGLRSVFQVSRELVEKNRIIYRPMLINSREKQLRQ